VRWLDRWGPAIGYSVTFAGCALAVRATPAATRDRILDWASTDLVNLRDHPIGCLVASAFVTDGSILAWSLLALVGLGVTGWRFGAGRTVLLVGLAHVLGTYVSEGVLGYRIATGAVGHDQLRVLDVGPSYVTVAALSAGLAYGTWLGRVPCAAGLALVGPGCFGALPELDLAAIGHTCSAAIGLVAGAWLWRSATRRDRPPTPSGARPAEDGMVVP
jgi:hypothetical protein